MGRTQKPPQMAMLEAKGIYSRDYFRFADGLGGCYAVSRNYVFIGLDGEPADLSEDDLWERYDAIEKISKGAFERAQAEYRDALWHSRGQPDAQELEALALLFLDAYRNHYGENRWRQVCGYDEETIRRLLDRVIDAFFPEPPTAAQRQKKYQALYRELVLVKASMAAGRSPANAMKTK